MKRALLLIPLALLLAISLVAIGCPAKEAPAEVIELRFNHMTPPCPLYDEVFGPWVDAINERSGGKVHITTYFVGELSPAEEAYDSLLSGLADIATEYCTITPGLFPCSECLGMPNLDTFCARLSPVAWELYQAFPEMQAEYADTKMLTLYAFRHPTSCLLGTAEKPIHTMEDLAGLKIQAPGIWASKKMAALGASPLTMPLPDIYISLEKKVIDGTMMDPGQLEDWNFRDVVDYMTMANFGYNIFWFTMSWDAWNSLPPDVQQIFEEESAKFRDTMDSFTTVQSQRAMDTAVAEYGVEIIELTPEEMARWKEATEPVREEFIADLEAKGLPGRELIEEADRLYEKYSE